MLSKLFEFIDTYLGTIRVFFIIAVALVVIYFVIKIAVFLIFMGSLD